MHNLTVYKLASVQDTLTYTCSDCAKITIPIVYKLTSLGDKTDTCINHISV